MEVPHVEPQEGARLVGAGAFMLDVREPDEWAAGHAPDANHIPLAEIATRTGDVPPGVIVVAVCRSGGRSHQAVEFLRMHGLKAVNMAGGMRAWSAAGLDVVADDGRPGIII